MKARIWASLMATTVTLSGCQLMPLKQFFTEPQKSTEAGAQSTERHAENNDTTRCYVGYDRLNGIFAAQRVYLISEPAKRAELLAATDKAKDYALKALLLSQPTASVSQLQRALDAYVQQPLSPSQLCPGDRYIALREVQTRYLMDEKKATQAMQKEVMQLQQTLKTLNRIEDSLAHDLEMKQ
ncbi:MAG: hypothetical protein ACPGPF_10095 [Pontibacterium sp.]